MAGSGRERAASRRPMRRGPPRTADPVDASLDSSYDAYEGDDAEPAPIIRPTLTLPSVSSRSSHALRAAQSSTSSQPGAWHARNFNPSTPDAGAWSKRDEVDGWHARGTWDERADDAVVDRPTLARSRIVTQAQPPARHGSGKQRAIVPLDDMAPLATPSGRRTLAP
ncbi:MAG: hypothetical protein ABI068_00455, partial [Ktedonobacterales bacterium]